MNRNNTPPPLLNHGLEGGMEDRGKAIQFLQLSDEADGSYSRFAGLRGNLDIDKYSERFTKQVKASHKRGAPRRYILKNGKMHRITGNGSHIMENLVTDNNAIIKDTRKQLSGSASWGNKDTISIGIQNGDNFNFKTSGSESLVWENNFWRSDGNTELLSGGSFYLSQGEFQSIAQRMGLSSQDTEFVQAVMLGIREQESNNNYNIQGTLLTRGSHKGTKAYGAYQIMPKNWGPWCKKHFGNVLAKTPANQDRVAFAQMAEYYKKYRTQYPNNPKRVAKEIFKSWYGRGTAMAGHPTTNQYVNQVIAKMSGQGSFDTLST